MVAITNPVTVLRSRLPWPHAAGIATTVVLAAVVLALGQHGGWWPAAVLVVVATELWLVRPVAGASLVERGRALLGRTAPLAIGLSTVMIVAASPRLVSQVGVAVLYAAWRLWWELRPAMRQGLAGLLIVQAAVFEAVFLMAAIWRSPEWLVLALAWLGAYVSVYAVLSSRGERAAGVMAATWAVVVVEVGGVLLWWLFTYTMTGGYVFVPQPALVLTALGYCFGSIYASQREGNLSRGRLAEYLVIGLILIAIVIMGTSWHGVS